MQTAHINADTWPARSPLCTARNIPGETLYAPGSGAWAAAHMAPLSETVIMCAACIAVANEVIAYELADAHGTPQQ